MNAYGSETRLPETNASELRSDAFAPLMAKLKLPVWPMPMPPPGAPPASQDPPVPAPPIQGPVKGEPLEPAGMSVIAAKSEAESEHPNAPSSGGGRNMKAVMYPPIDASVVFVRVTSSWPELPPR